MNSKSHSGFTLVEMLVAVAMGAALVAAAATVFSLASDAIGTSEANTQINSQLRVLFSWLDRDFARIRLDGPMGLYPRAADLDGSGGAPDPDERIDQMYFLMSGNIQSMTTAYGASLAIVLYGPDITVDAPPLLEPYEWVFSRRATLIVGDATAVGPDIQQSSFADLLAGGTPAVWTAALGAKPDFSDAAQLPAYLVANVVSFRIVRYYMAGDAAPTPLAADKVFGPLDEKPAWIEFEVVLRDRNNRLPDGFTATHRVNLPSR